MRRRVLLLPFFVVALHLGCGSPTRPTVAAAGSWAGTVTDGTSGSGTFQLILENPSGTQLVGTWSAIVAGQTVQGTASGSAVSTPNLLNLSCTGGGVGNMTITIASDRISGPYFFFGQVRCPPLDQGGVDLARR
jgi:hypothetical protein